MIITQVCLTLATIKDHYKMCSFTVLGGSEYHSLSGVTTICLTQCNTSPSHGVDQVVDCGMLVHSSSMALWSCWILAGTGTRCCLRRSRASQTCSISDLSSEYAGHPRTGMFSVSSNCVQILATWSRALSCCNMRWWSWMNGTTMGLRISSRFLCAFKMPSISITYACPSANRSPTRRHTRCLPSALYSENGFWQFVQKLFGYANRLLQQLSVWLVSDDLGGEDAGCGGPGLVWLYTVCSCEASWMYCQVLWNAFGDGLW